MPSAKKTAAPRPAARSWLLRILHSPWLWVTLACVPSVVLFCNRVLVPDFSTDVISYHLFNGMRAVNHPFVPFLPSEFYPAGIANIAPLYDALTYIARSVAGYRLGTGLSLLAVIGSLWLVYTLLKLMLAEQGKRFHAGWGLLLINAGIVLELEFQLATYDIDVINGFVVLAVLYLLVRQVLRDRKLPIGLGWWIGLWFAAGALVALKQTNAALAIPMMALLAWDWWRRPGKGDGKRIALTIICVAVSVVPLLPGWLNNYHLSHNPLYPFYNAVFHSPEYASVNYTDKTFGGTSLASRVFWPAASLSDQLRLGEPHHIYNDYKLVLYWALALILITLLVLRQARLGLTGRIMLFYFVGSALLWGLLFGILRYFISSMLLGGLVLAIPFMLDIAPPKRPLRWIAYGVGTAAVCIAAVLDYRIVHFNLRYDISWRPNYYQNEALHKAQKQSLFARQLTLNTAERQTVLNSDVFLNCNTNVAGLLALLPGAPSKPMVNIIADGLPQYADMANNNAYRQKVLQRLQTALPARHIYTWVSIVSDKDIGPTAPGCYRNLTAAGATINAYQPIDSLLGYGQIHLTMVSGQITL